MASHLKVLDLVFAMDCTGSMGSYIHEAQTNIKTIADEIVRQEKADLHLALVEYRDHPPQDKTFVTNVLDFTSSYREMKSRLDACSASGGGDAPEAVADALHALLKLSWRPDATKICVFVADAPPHGLGCGGDGFPEGCPAGLDPMVIGREIAEKGITIYMVGCEPSIVPYRDWFMAIAYLTGGQYVPLSSATLLPQVIIGGTQEEISLQHLMTDVNAEVIKLSDADDGTADEQQLVQTVLDQLKTKGVKTKHLESSHGGGLMQPTPKAIEISEKKTMAEVRSVFTPDTSARAYAAPGAAFGAGAAAGFDEKYEAVEREVSMSQASRLVQKSLMTNKLKTKVSSSSVSKKE